MMNNSERVFSEAPAWVFFGLVIGYGLYYAPFGVNETDGGFLTGLAWQVLSGKVLYLDVVYVRPPLPVWLRALELYFLPETWAILGERWIFYGKVALYSWLGAALLERGERRWWLAAFGFVVSAHCYPAMAWHTVDGVLFAVLAAFGAAHATRWGWALGGVALLASLLCKQSFYPLLPLFALFLVLERENRWKRMSWFFGGFLTILIVFLFYLQQNGLLHNFLNLTSGAASGGQALQHGILDYFRITPELALPSLVLLAPVVWWRWKGQHLRLAQWAWAIWLLALCASYVAVTWLRQEHTVPFAQSRAMFWVAATLVLARPLPARPLYLLAISWSAAVSWGYNLPILFATPWVWAGFEMSRHLGLRKGAFALLLVLLLTFRVGYEFVYRDGKREDMTESLGAIFPRLSGIYSDRETAERYRDLKRLAERYGPNFKTLPAFPQANLLTNTPPPLPLDWVVNRETNGNNELVMTDLSKMKPVIFIQKSFREKIESDPELALTRQVFQHGTLLEETPHFWVLRPGLN